MCDVVAAVGSDLTPGKSEAPISAWILSFFLATIISKLQFLQLGISFISNRAVNQHQQLGKERRRDDVSTLH